MNITQALPLLGGLSPARFMKRHWQKKPLLVRAAVPGNPGHSCHQRGNQEQCRDDDARVDSSAHLTDSSP